MKFHFNLSDDVYTQDEDGRDLPDIHAARRYAETNAKIMAAESVRNGLLNLLHYVEVTDGAGDFLLKVTFGEVVAVSS